MPRSSLLPRHPDPGRRIVLGYLSADFRRHSAAFIVLPILRRHDRAQFEIICYSCSPQRDEITAEFQSLADRWVDAVPLSDDALADRIQADRVILVDLSGHSGGNRLKVFARKPAPVQVSGWEIRPAPVFRSWTMFWRNRSRSTFGSASVRRANP
jgi:predicted O-linked N-acetylglucosamine transferase (SPINDLY family)